MTTIAKIRDLFRRKLFSDEQRRKREAARLAEKQILDRRVELRAAEMGLPPPRPDAPEDESEPGEA